MTMQCKGYAYQLQNVRAFGHFLIYMPVVFARIFKYPVIASIPVFVESLYHGANY